MPPGASLPSVWRFAPWWQVCLHRASTGPRQNAIPLPAVAHTGSLASPYTDCMLTGVGGTLPGRERDPAAHPHSPSRRAGPAPVLCPAQQPQPLEHQNSSLLPDSVDPLLRAASEDTLDEDDYGYQPDRYSHYPEPGSDEEGGPEYCEGPEYTDEDMADPAVFGVIGEPVGAIGEPFGHASVDGTAAGYPGAYAGGYSGMGRELPACFAMEADCRAAWAALQPAAEPLPWFAAPKQAPQDVGFSATGGMAAGMGAGAGEAPRSDCGSVAFTFDCSGTDGGGSDGSGGGGGPYAPQSTERRRKPRRKWDAAVKYEKITKRLELHFDAVAWEAPTTPPGHHAPARPTARALNFGAAPQQQAGTCTPSPEPQRSAMREAFPTRAAADGVRPMSGLQDGHRAADAPPFPAAQWGAGGLAGGNTLFAALEALGGAVDEDAMRSVVIGVALGLQVRRARRPLVNI